MGFLVKAKKSSNKVDPDTYNAIIEDFELGEHPKYGANIAWVFKLKGATVDGEEVSGECKVTCITGQELTTSNRNKLHKLIYAAGFDIEEDDEFDLDDMVGKKLRVTIQDDEKADGSVFSKVISFMRIKKKSSSDDEERKASSKKEKKKQETKKEAPDDEDSDDSSDDDDFNFDFGED